MPSKAFAYRDFHAASSIEGRYMESENWTSVADWPREWLDITFKTYPRMPRVPLPDEEWHSRLSLQQALLERSSGRTNVEEDLPLRSLSTLLREAMRIKPTEVDPGSRRVYPSAGARFPVEAYLVANRCEGVASGLYHYRPFDHSLEQLTVGPQREQLLKVFGHDWIADSRCVILLSGELSRSAVKYGDRAYRFSLIEAGHVMHNFLLIGTDLDVAVTPIGGFADDRMHRFLGFGPTEEHVLYSAVLS
ncbi:SagB/ThcOx family dehydrogenase [Kitasatospora sp. NPDC056531]|uniref:SagB/ThcOx family dehydrogenase n=1 Tax=Kitasatospora sp. NPDC056531 TaxID=3345856 RepID=UPI0036A08DDB